MALKRKAQKLVITIDNIEQDNAIALIKMFKYMQYLGNIGSSRMCSFFADGDGSFRPKISFDYPEELPEVEIDSVVEYDRETKKYNKDVRMSSGDFVIDPDAIAWKIYHDPEPEDYVRPKNPMEGALKISDKLNNK
jgi:hypothetical protein